MGWFSKRTQAELDADYLKSVSQLRLTRATQLLKKGARVDAVDDEGNTALHLLAAADPRADRADTSGVWVRTKSLDSFLPLLLKGGVDPHAFNKAGLTFLHILVANKQGSDTVLSRVLHHVGYNNMPTQDEFRRLPLHFAMTAVVAAILIRSGADREARDAAGRTLFHYVLDADSIDEDLAEYLIKTSSTCLLIKDNQGQLPNVRVPGYGSLRRQIDEARKSIEEENSAAIAAQAREESIAANAGWTLLDDMRVARVKNETELGYKLTEIFNFSTRTYTVLSCNLETKGEGVLVKDFDAFADKSLLQEAWRRLIALDGQADESVIYRQRLDKGAPRLPEQGAG